MEELLRRHRTTLQPRYLHPFRQHSLWQNRRPPRSGFTRRALPAFIPQWLMRRHAELSTPIATGFPSDRADRDPEPPPPAAERSLPPDLLGVGAAGRALPPLARLRGGGTKGGSSRYPPRQGEPRHREPRAARPASEVPPGGTEVSRSPQPPSPTPSGGGCGWQWVPPGRVRGCAGPPRRSIPGARGAPAPRPRRGARRRGSRRARRRARGKLWPRRRPPPAPHPHRPRFGEPGEPAAGGPGGGGGGKPAGAPRRGTGRGGEAGPAPGEGEEGERGGAGAEGGVSPGVLVYLGGSALGCR